jgi:UDP-N-acetylglucosamine transferase subunit ALG13
MIFVTVGTQLAFDRMVRTVDAWAGKSGAEAFAQIGPGEYVPQHMRWTRTMPADECTAHIRQAQAVVAHAGMGSILTALQLGKPIIVLPRRASLGEHRNDHQLTTAKHFQEQGRIQVAFSETELELQLERISTLQPSARISNSASPALIGALRDFVRGTAVRAATRVQSAAGSESLPSTAVARA